jgi:hypothetical protein
LSRPKLTKNSAAEEGVEGEEEEEGEEEGGGRGRGGEEKEEEEKYKRKSAFEYKRNFPLNDFLIPYLRHRTLTVNFKLVHL